MKKRLFSLLLTCSLLLSLVVIPGEATTEEKILVLDVISFTENGGFSEGTKLTSVTAGDTIALRLTLKNTTSDSFYVKAYDLGINYDESILEPYSFKNGRNTVGPVADGDMGTPTSNVTDGTAKIAWAATDGVELEASGKEYDSAVIAYFLFQVKSDAETSDSQFSFLADDDSLKWTKKIHGTKTKDETQTISMPNVTFDATASIHINGVAPTLNTVTFDQASVTVAGTADATVKATAESTKKTDITQTVTWSVTPADNGVSIAADGTVTVGAKAKAGDYTVTATPDGTSVQGAAKTAKLTVTRETAQATSMKLYKDGTPVSTTDTVVIPTGDTANTYAYSAKVFDQYDDEMSKSVTLELTTTDSYVTFNPSDGTLTVAKGATKDNTYTLTAKVGTLTEAVTITVKDIQITAPTVTTKSDPTYGDVWKDIVQFTGGSAELNGKTVEGSFYLKDAETVPNAGSQTYQIYFKSTDGAYDVPAKSDSVTIAQKELTVKAKDHSITYGEVGASDGVTYEGFVNGDTESKLTGSLSYTYGTYTTTSAVGKYDIIPSGLTSTNYDIKFKNGTLTVTARSLTDTMVTVNASALTYNAKAQEPNVTVTDSAATVTTNDYTVAYQNNTNAGTAKVIVTGKGNYTGTVEKSFTIGKATLTIASATFENRTYDGTTAATVKSVTFTGLQGSETLTLGTDYTAVGEFTQAGVGTGIQASVTVTLKDTAITKNYQLSTNSLSNAGTADIEPVQTTLVLEAKDAVYTGLAYAESNITKTSNVADLPTYTYYEDNNGVKGTQLSGAPVNAGVYWVVGDITASGNNSAVTSGAVRFQITKAPLTVTAENRAVTYGDAAPSYSVTYTGLVNSEVGTNIVANLNYDCKYTQYGDVGEYVITPTADEADNYAITFQTGKLTVEQLEATLAWSATTLYWDGTEKSITATVSNAVNSDELTVTVVGGTQTAVGTYTAKATAISGDKAKNYTLPSVTTSSYSIENALSSVTVTPTTITAVIDGLTIKLTGYKATGNTITVTGGGQTAVGNQLTLNGVTYTVDDSGVVVNDSNATITTGTSTTEDNTGITGGYTETPTVNGLESSAAEEIIKEAKENDTVTQVEVSLKVEAKSYTDKTTKKELTLNITPVVTYKDTSGNAVGEEKQVIPNSALKSPVTIKIKLPSGMVSSMAAKMFAKHFLTNGSFEMLTVTLTQSGSDYFAEWQQSSFSDVTLLVDDRTATVSFTFDDGSGITKTYSPAEIGSDLPTDSKASHTFDGWKFTADSSAVAGTYKTLTDDLLTALSSKTTITAEPQFTKNTTPNNPGTSNPPNTPSTPSNPSTPSYPNNPGYYYPVINRNSVVAAQTEHGTVNMNPTTAGAGEVVTITVTPDAGYELDTIRVVDKFGNIVTLTERNGKYTFVMPSCAVTVHTTFVKETKEEEQKITFVDVPENEYYAEAVAWAVKNHITNGMTATRFMPEETCTRGQIVTFLWRAAGSPAPKGVVGVPDDVKTDSYYYDAVVWALENGITNGVTATSFAPDDPCTRAQSVTFLYRAVGTVPDIAAAFTDIKSDAYYSDAVAWAVENGVTNGVSKTEFAPEAPCTRGQIVTFLYRAYQDE